MPILYGAGLSDTEIASLEDYFDIKLPVDYKKFLLDYNGLLIKYPDYCNIEYHGVDDSVAVNALFGYMIENKIFDLKGQNDNFLDEIFFIKNSIIIGVDPGDNFYVLVVCGEFSGVYYWDRTHLHSDDSKQNYFFEEVNECGNLYRVADSFDSFFKIIYDYAKAHNMSFDKGL